MSEKQMFPYTEFRMWCVHTGCKVMCFVFFFFNFVLIFIRVRLNISLKSVDISFEFSCFDSVSL